MGQVYSTLVVTTGISGSSAIPQLGHGPGLVSRTSGHMRQTSFSVVFCFVSSSGPEAIDCRRATPTETNSGEFIDDDRLGNLSGSALNFSRQRSQQK
jgi:hypothetical protein